MDVKWDKFRTEFKIWRYAALPGLAVLMLVILARMTGLLQFLEWTLLDAFLRLRPPEPIDERVVIVGINEDDIAKTGKYPIPDGEIADLLDKLATYQPRAIGLDLIKNVPVEPGHDKLVKTFQNHKNIFAIEKVIKPPISAPSFVPSDRIGFADVIPDSDGKYRRYILHTPDPKNWKNENEDRSSLALQLASSYLESRGITSEAGKKDPDTIRFGSTELPRITPTFGGYVKEDTGDLQVLINFRHANKPFRIFSLNEIKTGNTSQGKINPELLRDKIILVGNVSPSGNDKLYTLAIPGQQIPGLMYGVEYHAHATSQIISAVLNNRSMLVSWAEPWEYVWIVIWGIIPIKIGRSNKQSTWKKLLLVGAANVLLVGFGYIYLLYGKTWIPVVPSLLTVTINGAAFIAFYKHEELLRSKIDERQRTIDSKINTIDHAFRIIHNGPLQILADGLRHLKKQDLPQERLIYMFERLNKEIRDIGDDLKQEALTNDKSLRLGSGLKINLNDQIHNLFYDVYSSTLERDDLEYLQTLKVKSVTFDPIDDKYLSMELKRKLCQFLEESLCNVGKHAQGVKRVEASGTYTDGCYTLRIKDNAGVMTFAENKGTQDSQDLAKILNGSFKREQIKPQGVLCELTWKLTTFVHK